MPQFDGGGAVAQNINKQGQAHVRDDSEASELRQFRGIREAK